MHCVLTCDKKLEPAVGSMKILTALLWSSYWTTCVRGAPASCNIFAFIRQVAAVPACWLFKTSATSWPFDLESGVLVACERCDMGYLCVNFSLPRPLCSRLRPTTDVKQTYVRQKHRLMPLPYGVTSHGSHPQVLKLNLQISPIPTNLSVWESITSAEV